MSPHDFMVLFYPTSPVHVRDMRLVMDKLTGWSCQAIVYRPLAKVAPGIALALREHGFDYLYLGREPDLNQVLPERATLLMLGAIFEPFALDLFAWAKERRRAVVAIEEVAQLALNQLDICNYDAPLDHLFVASREERRLFIDLGHPAERLSVTGLLANDRFADKHTRENDVMLKRFGIANGQKPIIYTTSPLKSRRAIHNTDDAEFRDQVLAQIAHAAQRAERAVIVKLHPNEDLERERHRIIRVIPNAIVCGRELGMEELFPIAAVLVNRGNSQTCLEAVLRGVPTVVAACGCRTLFHADGGAYVVDQIGLLANAIETALCQKAPDSAVVRAKHSYFPVDGVAGAIAGKLGAIAQREWPADEQTWNWLMRSLLFLGQHQRAARLSERLNLDTDWQRQVRAALRAHTQGRLQEAIEAWTACSALDPPWFYPHYELAHSLSAVGDQRAALHHARQAIALHPPFHTLWHALPMRVVAMQALRELGDPAAAAAELSALEQRGLLKIVPELQIEAAAQARQTVNGSNVAENYLEKAIDLLKELPVDKETDRNILARALRLKFQRYWRATPRNILKPLKLGGIALAWLCQRLTRNRFHNCPYDLMAMLLVWRHIAGHFGRRLRAERARLFASKRNFRALLPNTISRQAQPTDLCPICSERGSFAYRNKASMLLRCRACSHVYACDLPSDKTLNDLYGDFTYWEKDRCHQGITAIEDGPGWQIYLNARVGILEKLGLLTVQPKRVKKVFEIGCAEGMLLRELGKRGMEVAGCEMNRAVAAQGMAKLGIPILMQPFEDLDFCAQGFDLVMSFHTLEHMRFPADVMARVANMLNPDGAVLIEVPCSDNEYDNTDHLHFFSETSLRLLLEGYFTDSEIVPNSYTTSAGIRCGSIYGVGRLPRQRRNVTLPAQPVRFDAVPHQGSEVIS